MTVRVRLGQHNRKRHSIRCFGDATFYRLCAKIELCLLAQLLASIIDCRNGLLYSDFKRNTHRDKGYGHFGGLLGRMTFVRQ